MTPETTRAGEYRATGAASAAGAANLMRAMQVGGGGDDCALALIWRG